MNKRRLLKLADLLEADAKKKDGIKFNMGTFGTVRNESDKLSCGTQACALGLAALSGAFKRAGLDVEIEDEGALVFKWKNHKTTDGFWVAQRLFEMDRWDASNLFGIGAVTVDQGRGARAEIAVAKNIRKFVAAER